MTTSSTFTDRGETSAAGVALDMVSLNPFKSLRLVEAAFAFSTSQFGRVASKLSLLGISESLELQVSLLGGTKAVVVEAPSRNQKEKQQKNQLPIIIIIVVVLVMVGYWNGM